MTVPETRFVAAELLSVIRKDADRADTKASVLLSVVVALGTVLSARSQSRSGSATAVALLLLAGGCWLLGTVSLLRAVVPRVGTKREGPGLTFYADVLAVHRAAGAAGVRSAVREAAGDPTTWLLIQIIDMSHILDVKHRCIRWGVLWLLSGLVCGAIGLQTG
ncbi:Pycsar system effector family protein [Streptomyces sp. SPB162]|uniref:Pycsar system effector family protein n=1 Tax=Streptomyces sp. SPB162 TaxID=2940560 RepID=UPI002405D8EA|nr:Pycsar system effector family protein [Streptomyces sp. SPB162]